jgi:hypothetical protein
MKGDPPSLQQMVEKYGDPVDNMAASHFDALARAEESEAAGAVDEAVAWRQVAARCLKSLAKYGFVAGWVDGVAKAVPPK